MAVFEEQYKKALIEIEEKLKVIEKDKELFVQLNIDKENIIKYFHPKITNQNLNLETIEIDKEESNMVTHNQLNFCPLSRIFFINRNDNSIEKLFVNFIEEDTFGLKKIYDEIIYNKELIYTKTENNFWGRNIFIPSIKRNFIEIKKSNKLYEVCSIVHELGHAKTNIECFKLPYVSKKNSFLESYSIFLELVFADYLKNNGKRKQGYELKFLIFQKIKDIIEQLYEDLNEHKSDIKTKYFFEMNYKTLKGYCLALYFYDLYQLNPNESLKLINNFIKEVKLLDDNELINKFNINKNCFSNHNVYKLYKQLKEEKTKIKQK